MTDKLSGHTFENIHGLPKFQFLTRLEDQQPPPAHRLCPWCFCYHLRETSPIIKAESEPCAWRVTQRGQAAMFPFRNKPWITRHCTCAFPDPPAPGTAVPFEALNWPVIQLVTRAHRLGSEYGYPLSYLQTESNADWSKAHWRVETDAAVEAGHLLLRVECNRRLMATIGYKSFRCGGTDDWEHELPHCRHVAAGVYDPSASYPITFEPLRLGAAIPHSTSPRCLNLPESTHARSVHRLGKWIW